MRKKFETEWGEHPYHGLIVLKHPDVGVDAVMIEIYCRSSPSTRWFLFNPDDACDVVEEGVAASIDDAKAQSLAAAGRHGWDITIKGECEEEKPQEQPFVIEDFTYFTLGNELIVVLPYNSKYGSAAYHRYVYDGSWIPATAALRPGWKHEPNPEFRHPDDPVSHLQQAIGAVRQFGKELIMKAVDAVDGESTQR